MSNGKKIGIVGVGKVGTAIGVLLQEMGYEVGFISSTNPEKLEIAAQEMSKGKGDVVTTSQDPIPNSKDVDILFITTPDRVIGEVASDIAKGGGFKKGQIVVHMSGSLTSDILAPAREAGAYVASLHPLQSFADFVQAKINIPGSVFCLEGDTETKSELKKIIEIFNGTEVEIPKEEKPLYHAGAVVASNYLLSLVWAALMMYEVIGLDKGTALSALMPLIEGTLKNIKALGAPKALTGPISRGDVQTVSDHIDAIKEKIPHLLEFYQVMGRLTVEAANENKSAPEELLGKILDVIK